MVPFCEVWCCDTEFQAGAGEKPFVLCLVARELHTQREIRLWRDDLIELTAAPFNVGDDALFVAFFASAELGCFLQLGWPLPINVVDLYAEHRVSTNGLKLPDGNSLLGVLARHGLAHMESTEKHSKRDLILGQSSWTAEEIAEILHYCAADVTGTEVLLKRMQEELDWPRALWRGRYSAAIASMEHCGVPVDLGLYNQLVDHWDALKLGLVRTIDADYGIYEGTTFKEANFAAWLSRNGIPWPRHQSGHLLLDKDTFKDRANAWPIVAPLRELRRTLGMMRLTDLEVGSDGRNRTLLSPFGTVTGRNTPSNSKFIFGAAKWLRGLVQPPPGYGIVYLDWSAQEFALAAALSGDERMLADYAAGDPHLEFAKTARLVPPDATKATHPVMRERCKQTNLGVLYGMRARGLAYRLGMTVADAEELLRMHKGAYRRYWAWSDAMVPTALMRREIHTAFGWRMITSRHTKNGTLMNWPMQSHASDMMRGAAVAATESGLAIAAPIHDAFLLLAPLGALDADADAMRGIMEVASEVVTDGVRVRVDTLTIRYPDRYPGNGEMWDIAMKELESCIAQTLKAA